MYLVCHTVFLVLKLWCAFMVSAVCSYTAVCSLRTPLDVCCLLSRLLLLGGKVCNCENELPAVNLALGYSQRAGGASQVGRDANSVTEAEKLGRWFTSSWEGKCPEMAQLRDIVFLNKLMLEPSGLLANDRNHNGWPSLW